MNSKPMEKYVIVKRAYRQHNSLVITLPWFFRKEFNVRPGDHIEISWKYGQKHVKLSKVKAKEWPHGRSKGVEY